MTLWKQQDGITIAVEDMDTSHIVNCVRMLWNHLCPVHLQLRPFKRYYLRMPRQYIESRLAAMADTLRERDDLTEEQIAILEHIGQQPLQTIIAGNQVQADRDRVNLYFDMRDLPPSELPWN